VLCFSVFTFFVFILGKNSTFSRLTDRIDVCGGSVLPLPATDCGGQVWPTICLCRV
jgi:hypothetical protein